MIRKIKVICARYSGLNEFFPEGREFETDSGLVLLVGPNGSGKTAFMRMLASSIENNDFFEKAGISRASYTYKAGSRTVLEAAQLMKDRPPREIIPDWYDFPLGSYLVESLACDPRFKLSPEKDLRKIKCNKKATPNAPMACIGDTLDCISAKALKQFEELEKTFREPTELNRYGYLKPDIEGGKVYVQECSPSVFLNNPHDRDIKNGYRRNINFDPNYDGRKETWCQADFASSGQCLDYNVAKVFTDIKRFFDERKNPLWLRRDDSIEGQLKMWATDFERQYEDVPEDAQLVVFMDEPSVYFDYERKIKFQRALAGLVKDYQPRLQVFTATNDPVLIERTRDSRFISLYKQPAESSSKPPVFQSQ